MLESPETSPDPALRGDGPTSGSGPSHAHAGSDATASGPALGAPGRDIAGHDDRKASLSRFESILYGGSDTPDQLKDAAPDHFVDLNCDQVVNAVTAGMDDYDLKPFFYSPLSQVAAVEYRQAIARDLEKPPVLESVRLFAQAMTEIRQHLRQVSKLYYRENQQARFLDGVENYCRAVRSFADSLAAVPLASAGWLSFRDYVRTYSESEYFRALRAEAASLRSRLSRLRYTVLIDGDTFTVRRFDGEADYSIEVLHTFEKFAQGETKDYRLQFKPTDEMNHIEAKILEFVGRLYPDEFSDLDLFFTRNAGFIDKTIATYDREVRFYMSYFDYIAPLKSAGLQFCYPQLGEDKAISSRDGFDLALAQKLVAANTAVVCNDFKLSGPERILVVSGPNQGGKTTFARAFGQLHYLASLGLPVPGRESRLFLCDRIFTHFERQERVETLRGKLEDDLVRIHRILETATPRSIIVMNEIFTSTTISDETFLSKKIMEKLVVLDVLCVWVTFVDELASFGPHTVSMVSTVEPKDPTRRTFKIERRRADGLAYAISIAQKYGLTYDAIQERLKS